MRFTLTLSSLLLIISCQYALSQDYTIRGFIYEKANGEPMAFEKVKLLSASDSAIVSGGLTDVNGFFSISKISKGKYILKVENFSYNTVTRNIEVTAEKGIFDLKFELDGFEHPLESDVRQQGTVLFFPSFVPHKVTPVTFGKLLSSVTVLPVNVNPF